MQVIKDRPLGFDPLCVSWFPKGDFLLISGSNKQCYVYTRDGIQLGLVAEMPSWIWSAKVRPDMNHVVS
jgi:intraflagellar transport protein 122